MRYISKSESVVDRLSRYELMNYRKQRKISIIKNMPFYMWTKEELADLISEYDSYNLIGCKIYKKEEPVTISQFVSSGRYEKYSLFEHLKMGE